MHVMPYSHHGKRERNRQALPSESALPEGLSQCRCTGSPAGVSRGRRPVARQHPVARSLEAELAGWLGVLLPWMCSLRKSALMNPEEQFVIRLLNVLQQSTLLAGISLSGSLGPVVNEDFSSGSAVLLPHIQRSWEPPRVSSSPQESMLTEPQRAAWSHRPGLLSARAPGNQAQRAGSSPNRVVPRPRITVTSPGPRQPLFSISSAALPPHPLSYPPSPGLVLGAYCLTWSAFVTPFCSGHGSH